MRHLLDPVQGSDVVEGINARRQATVQAKDLVVDQSCERKVVEEVGKVLPHVGVSVLAQALVIEPVHLSDLARLMVAAQDGDAQRVSDLQGHKQGDSLDRVVSSIDIIPCIVPILSETLNPITASFAFYSRRSRRGETQCGPCHTHEKIVGVRVGPANLEEFHQVVKLAVDVSAHGDRAFLRASVSRTGYVF